MGRTQYLDWLVAVGVLAAMVVVAGPAWGQADPTATVVQRLAAIEDNLLVIMGAALGLVGLVMAVLKLAMNFGQWPYILFLFVAAGLVAGWDAIRTLFVA